MKKIILIVVIVLVLAGGGAGGYFYAKSKSSSSEKDSKTKETTSHTTSSSWNPYSAEEHYQKTLGDFLISAVQGDYVVKMTVTIGLKDEEAKEKYEGLAKALTEKEREAAASAEHSSSETTADLTPMEIAINSKIGSFMLHADEATIHNKDELATKLKEYLNKELGMDNDFIKELYIENYVIQ